MKVAIAIHPFGRSGGAERLAIMHAVGLSKRGYDVKFYTDTSTLDPNWVDLLRQNVEVKNLPYGLSAGGAVREMEQADCILIHHHVEPLVALRIALKYGYKTCMYVGELTRAIWERQLTGGDYRQFSPSVYQTAKHFYGPVSTLALKGPVYDLTTALLRVLDRMTIMRCGMVIANSNYTAEITRRILGYKGPIPVVYPASGIPSSMFHPKVGDAALCRLYEGSLFVAVSSLSEPFGMTPVEGALAGKPSVVGAVGGTREFVLDGETGLVVNSTSVRHMAGALRLLLEDTNLRKAMGQRARDRALSHFTLDNSVTSLAGALNVLA